MRKKVMLAKLIELEPRIAKLLALDLQDTRVCAALNRTYVIADIAEQHGLLVVQSIHFLMDDCTRAILTKTKMPI